MNRRVKRLWSLVITIVMMFCIVQVPAVYGADYPNTHINTGDQRVDIVSIARTQIGYREGNNNDTKYGAWYGLNYNPWCAMFVSWCARQAGVSTDILKNCAMACPYPGYFDIPYYDGEEYTPKQGDLFFTKTLSHVGIVDYADGEYFYTIEGNTNDNGSSTGIGVFALKRKISDYIFGVPDYNYASKNHTCNTDEFVKYSEEHPHYAIRRCSVCAKVSEDNTDCQKADGCVKCSAPQKPELVVYNDSFNGDYAVTFEWEEDKDAGYYEFFLYEQKADGEWKEYEFVYGAVSGFTWCLPEGRYRCRLKVYNPKYKDSDNPYGLCTVGDWKDFSIDKVKYEIIYDIGSGIQTTQVQKKNQGVDCILKSEIPIRDGYIFMGWSESREADTVNYFPNDVWSDDASGVLYAVWKSEKNFGLLGDANKDEEVNVKDATLIQKHLASVSQISPDNLIFADADTNGDINIKDATVIQKHLAGIATGFGIGEPLP